MVDYTEALKGYRRARNPDLIKLGELVKSARGVERSVRQFAEETDVNPSTISRIENAKMNGVSNDLLVKIAEKADPLSGVTLKELLYANGLEQYTGYSMMMKRREFEKLSADVIREELFIGGFPFANAVGLEIPAHHGYKPDMLIKTDALDGAWMLDFKWVNPKLYENDKQAGLSVPASRLLETIFQHMSIFYCGPSEIKKVSIVINSPEIFNYVVESIQRKLNGIKIKDLMSLILIDEDRRYIAKEWHLPTEQDTPKVFKYEPPKEPEDQDDLLDDLVEGQYNLFDVIADIESEKKKNGDNDEGN